SKALAVGRSQQDIATTSERYIASTFQSGSEITMGFVDPVLPGIGGWTASYIAMRAWSWPDVFLAGDYLIKQRFPGMTPRQIERYAERWRPWRSYATLHLWHNDGWAPEGDE
ncbi:MAG: hypothetical protein E7J62_23800, partial [Serratia marcescens]|nr:hypothetical protein [Serratia marcescens]